MATIIGKTGPDANPETAKAAIASSVVGATTATTTARPATTDAIAANGACGKRSADRAATRRPRARPAQNADRPRVAVATGTSSRNRTIQLDTPTSPAT